METVSDLSPLSPGLDRRSVHVRFEKVKLALKFVRLHVFHFSAVTVIQPVIYNFYVNPEKIEGYHAECGLWCVLLPFIEVVLSRPVLSCCDVLSLRTFCP